MMDRANWLDDNADLPEGWALPRLGDGLLSDIQPGFPCGTHNKDGDGVSHLRPMNVNVSGRIDLSVVKSVPNDAARDADRWLESGDILFNNTNSPELVGKTAYYGLHGRRAFSNHMTRLRVRDDVLDANYCAMALHAHWQAGYFQEVCNNHVSQASISREVLFNTTIPLPPVAEQKRIVDAIQRLTVRADAARERLVEVPAILKRFRQAVLAAACSGRLTEDRRVSDETTQDALTALVESRRCLLETPGTPVGKRKRPVWDEWDAVAIDGPFELPNNWEWINAGAAYSLAGYGTSMKSEQGRSDGVPVLGVPNIASGRLQPEGAKRSSIAAKDLANVLLQTGDIIVCRTNGSLALIGKAAVIPKLPEPHAFASYLIRVRTIRAILLPEYFHLVVSGPVGRDQIEELARSTAGQFNLSLRILGGLKTPLPPLEEQVEIVRRVEALLKLADAIEQRVALASARADKVTQAILAKAFRGELVHTEANLARTEGREYEPADKMLARLQATDNGDPPRRTRSPHRRIGSSAR